MQFNEKLPDSGSQLDDKVHFAQSITGWVVSLNK